MDTSTHTIDVHPARIAASPKDPTEENAFGWSTLSPESAICLHQSECADATVLPWETLLVMLDAAGYELTVKRSVDQVLKGNVFKRLTKNEVTLPKDLADELSVSDQDVYDAIYELVREKKIVEDMRDDGYMGYKLV